MIVILAVSGPRTQSASDTGGKSERWVGPGVGMGLITVQPGREVGETVFVGGTGVWMVGFRPTQAVNNTNRAIHRRLNIFYSVENSPNFTSEMTFLICLRLYIFDCPFINRYNFLR